MDNQTKSFLELTAANDLVQLVADKRAAWLWSADGARILWANAAGAAFFSSRSLNELAGLTSLERSPARPHIARIAESGLADRFTIDRLRFYRGLRVMLLTCQCKRIVLDSGEAAALIICTDKGLMTTSDPVAAFAQLTSTTGLTVFVMSGDTVDNRIGTLETPPHLSASANSEKMTRGPFELNGTSHEGIVLQIPAGPRLAVIDNAPLEIVQHALPDAEADQSADQPGAPSELSADERHDDSDDDGVEIQPAGAATSSAWVRADAADLEPGLNDNDGGRLSPLLEMPADPPFEPEDGTPVPSMTGAEDGDQADEGAADEGPTDEEGADEVPADKPVASETVEGETAEAAQSGPEPEDRLGEADAQSDFVFQPRRRPVRFAWKMDIHQRFTFLSEEFGEVLGPGTTGIVGETWLDVATQFGLDPRGSIARALGRRDTWSGKTVYWPVTGASLRVPVDMAALPAFDRERKFEGYRGFGVCRTADAMQDKDGFIINMVRAAFDESPDGQEPDPEDYPELADETGAQLLSGDEPGQEADTDSQVSGQSGPDQADPELTDTGQSGADQTSPEQLGLEQTSDDLTGSDQTGVGEPEPETSETGDTESGTPVPVADADEDPADSADKDTITGDDVSDEATEDLPTAADASDDGDLPDPELSQEQVPDESSDQVLAAEDALENLKPAQPESLAGRTFLGASAAALVGSLAKLTGKSGSASSGEQASQKTLAAGPSAAERALNKPEDLAEDLRAAAAALDGQPETRQPLETSEPANANEAPAEPEAEASTETETETDPGLELEAETEFEAEVETEAEPETAEDSETEALPETVAGTEPEETGSAQDPLLQDTEEPDGTEDPVAASQDESAETDAPDEMDTGEAEDASEAGVEPETGGEKVGISGPAELKPAEIESAVKSLASTYKARRANAPDLFSENELTEPALHFVGEDDDTTAEPSSEDISAANLMEVPESLQDDLPNEEDDQEAADLMEAAAAGDAEPDAGTDTALQDNSDVEEREFFEETAAFQQEDEAQDTDEDDQPAPVTTGKVIPLATARPRVVPVDTSSLSRPERQAFRKIAEALGARLEGDLEDFEAPDTNEQDEFEDLPPDVPEAGPIDPSLLDRLPIGIAIAHDREVLYANKALLSMLGYKSISQLSEAGGLEALFIDDTEDLPDADGMDGEVDETLKLRLSDGGVLSVDAHMHSVPWNGSRGLMISITERPVKPATGGPALAAEAPSPPNFFAEVRGELESARNQIAEMDTILETATDGVLVLDVNGTILKVNGSAEALFSANRAEMIGAPFTEFLAPESHQSAADYLDGLSRNGVASILNDGREVLGKVPAGGLIPLFMTMGRITGDQDDAKFCAVLRDITQWKTAEEELTQAKRQAENASSQKSDFLAKISHEIRTPLNAIIGFSEVMIEERFGPIGNDRYKDYLKDIRTSGSHIMSLINDLLDLSKIEAGKLDLQFSAVSTNDVINECVALMQPQANRERVIIRASLPESVPDVVADPRSLRQIVLNLLSNAIKYNKSGGQVILSTALESNGEVALRVRDTGTGMTSKQLAAALEPFRQLHTTSRGGGTGLGLPLTKALVEANRAAFHIDSTPDQGTLVEILFPTQRVLSE